MEQLKPWNIYSDILSLFFPEGEEPSGCAVCHFTYQWILSLYLPASGVGYNRLWQMSEGNLHD